MWDTTILVDPKTNSEVHLNVWTAHHCKIVGKYVPNILVYLGYTVGTDYSYILQSLFCIGVVIL